MGRWFTKGFAERQPETVAWARNLLTSTPETGYIGCATAIQKMDLRDDLSSITAPTLVIAGTDDPSTPPDHAQQIVAGIPKARLEIVPDAAHLANVEQAETVTRLLVEFLGGNDDRTR
jgi:3-oxoadipate enol-lactonase